MSSDVWTESTASPLGSTDSPLDVATAVFEDFKTNIMGYVMSGLAYFLISLVIVFVAMGALGLMIPGVLMEDEAMMMIGGLVGFGIYTAVIFGFTFLIVPLINASLMRAIDAQRRGEGDLGFMSVISTARENAANIIIFYLMGQAMVFVGLMFFYIPGFVAMAVVSFALPFVVFEEASPIEAVSKAWAHMQEHAAWHFGVWASAFAAILVLEITIVGIVVLYPVLVAWQVFAYRIAYPEA